MPILTLLVGGVSAKCVRFAILRAANLNLHVNPMRPVRVYLQLCIQHTSTHRSALPHCPSLVSCIWSVFHYFFLLCVPYISCNRCFLPPHDPRLFPVTRWRTPTEMTGVRLYSFVHVRGRGWQWHYQSEPERITSSKVDQISQSKH